MAVYVDNWYTTGAGQYGRMKMSHMVADTHSELVKMAKNIGVSTKWIQKQGTKQEHFDVCMAMRQKAIQLGAKDIHWREITDIRLNQINWDKYHDS